MDFLHNLSLQKGIDEWQVKQAAKALEFLYRHFLNTDLGIDPDKYVRDEGSSKRNAGSFIFKDTGVNPIDCTKCNRVFRQDHHPGKGERIMS